MPTPRFSDFKRVMPVRPDYVLRLDQMNIRKAAMAVKGSTSQLEDGTLLLFITTQHGETLAGRAGDFLVARAGFPDPSFELLDEKQTINRYGIGAIR